MAWYVAGERLTLTSFRSDTDVSEREATHRKLTAAPSGMFGSTERTKSSSRRVRLRALRSSVVRVEGALMVKVLAAVADFERDLIIERTQAGQARARAQGTHMGRPSKTNEADRVVTFATSNEGVMTTHAVGHDKGTTAELNPYYGTNHFGSTAQNPNGSPVTELLPTTLVKIDGVQAPISFWVGELDNNVIPSLPKTFGHPSQ